MSSSSDPASPDLKLVFVPVPEAKTVKNRVHIDVNPVGCDQEKEVARILALGARRIDIGQGEVPWVVLADPDAAATEALPRPLVPVVPIVANGQLVPKLPATARTTMVSSQRWRDRRRGEDGPLGSG